MSTRFHFPRTEVSQISPSFQAGWGTTTGATRFFMSDDSCRTGSSIVIGPTLSWTTVAQTKALDRQYVSRGLSAQVISGSVSGQLMVREFNAGNNTDVIIVYIGVVSNDGSASRGTLLSLGNKSTTGEFVVNATCRNKIFCAATNLTSVTAQNGDRIVVELGYSNTTLATVAPQGAAKWGDIGNGTDLPAGNEAQTSDGLGWIEFSQDLIFKPRTINFIHDGSGA
jgi:hypothetical protein